MAKIGKLQVIDEREESQVPFLRGILTRSLTRVGIPFEKAYVISSSIRDEVAGKSAITTTELRSIVHEKLIRRKFTDEAQRYLDAAKAEPLILVTGGDGVETPFSKGLLGQSLEICALERDSAYRIASTIEQKLYAENEHNISSREIEDRTYNEIFGQEGITLANRYRKWLSFSRGGRPIVLLIGGTTGSGKSTLSAELSHRLNIVRTQSTDMLREVMRLMVPEALLPTLHTSSFQAYKSLPHWESDSDTVGEPSMIAGYLSQSDHVKLGIEGVLRRVRNERVSLILEGVHIHPALQHRIESTSEALVVPMILGVLKKKRLQQRLEGRGQQVSSRKFERYLKHFDQIWELQSFLLSEADRFNTPLVLGEDEEAVRRMAMHTISEYVARDSPRVNSGE